MSKFVVTGSRGYVARKLIRRLVADGHEVVGLTRGGTTEDTEPGLREVVAGDYFDGALLERAVSGAHAVFHLAARAHQHGVGKEEASLLYTANVLTTEAIARACIVSGVGRFVLASSIGVLGNRTDVAAFSDATALAPVDSYAFSKALAERRVTEVLAYGNCDFCILRPPLIYGPSSPGNFASLVTIAAKAPLVPLAGILAPRTFIYVDHFVDALLVAASHPAASRRTFVIADGVDTSVSEIICSAARIFGREDWRVFAIPEVLLRAMGVLAGQRARLDKLFAPLRVDATGFHTATNWHPANHASEAIAATIRDWRFSPTP
jgi:nucleoside-diphosphate-sugar epimerase